MSNIIDIIIHGKYKQMSIIVDEMPKLAYARKGSLLIAEDDGFHNCYKYGKPSPSWQAFAGRRFDISMKDGTVEHAIGQWWDYWNDSITQKVVIKCGVNTIEGLRKCYVFMAYKVDEDKVNKWMRGNKVDTDYYKYEKRICGKNAV